MSPVQTQRYHTNKCRVPHDPHAARDMHRAPLAPSHGRPENPTAGYFLVS